MLNEDLYCLSMRAHAELSDRASVARIYAELQALLKAELNAKPMPETVKFFNELTSKN